MYARIKNKVIDEHDLEKFIAEFFLPKNNIIIRKTKNSVTYDGIYEDSKVVVSFINVKKTPYNVYDSCICNGEFQYTQLIIFDIKKEYASIDEYKKILDFCIHLKKKVKSDILVTTDVHDEICLLKKQDIIWSSNISF